MHVQKYGKNYREFFFAYFPGIIFRRKVIVQAVTVLNFYTTFYESIIFPLC